jgi:ATP-dependent RNA helicase RhlE
MTPRFQDLGLRPELLRALADVGYEQPTPIQQQSIPHLLLGKDVLGCAQTGTGKTAAFALPIIQRLMENPRQTKGVRVLVLAPTRELASQIGESFRDYGKHTRIKTVVIFGGVGQTPQVEALKRGPEVLVAAPGRLLDLMGQGFIKLDQVETFVLDEADRMLDMGFIQPVRQIIKALPRNRQNLLFSATMPGEIQQLADSILHQPVKVAVTPVASTVELIQQKVMFVDKKLKPSLLKHILGDRSVKRALVFTRTKHGANKVVQVLDKGGIQAEAIHGNKSQTARENALANFKAGSTRVLVATDIAARGIDVDDITHVINFDLPHEPETYVHRIGRTARAGASGVAYSFCDAEERPLLRDIERLIRLKVPVIDDHPYPPGTPLPAGAIVVEQPLPGQYLGDGNRRGNRPQGQGGRNSNGGQRSGNGNAQGQGSRPAAAQPRREPQGSTTGSTQQPSDGQGEGQRRRRRRRPSGQGNPNPVR